MTNSTDQEMPTYKVDLNPMPEGYTPNISVKANEEFTIVFSEEDKRSKTR